jgi:histidinol-phosphatase (PHP family)
MMNYDVPGGELFEMKVDELYEELAAVRERYAGLVKVIIGTELGQPQVNPAAAKAFLAEHPLDFVIGSVHNMENDLDVYYYDFDQVDGAALFDHYLDWLIQMACTCDFDVVGHITYPLRYLFERKGERISLRPFEEKLRHLFKILIQSGRGIELNTSGMTRLMQETLPPFSVVRLYRECGGEIITIGSDAHTRRQIGIYSRRAPDLLKAAGFRYQTVYEERRPFFIPL